MQEEDSSGCALRMTLGILRMTLGILRMTLGILRITFNIGDTQDNIGDPQNDILGYKDYPHSASNSSLVSFSFFKSSSAHLISTSLFSDMSSCAFL